MIDIKNRADTTLTQIETLLGGAESESSVDAQQADEQQTEGEILVDGMEGDPETDPLAEIRLQLETLQTEAATLQTELQPLKGLPPEVEGNKGAVTALDTRLNQLQGMLGMLSLKVDKIDDLRDTIRLLEMQINRLNTLVVPENSAAAEADNRAPEPFD